MHIYEGDVCCSHNAYILSFHEVFFITVVVTSSHKLNIFVSVAAVSSINFSFSEDEI